MIRNTPGCIAQMRTGKALAGSSYDLYSVVGLQVPPLVRLEFEQAENRNALN